jgi:hypothetical protein
MVGAVRGIDPRTGHHVDDTRRYVEAVGPAPGDREKVFERNARRVYPRLDAALAARTPQADDGSAGSEPGPPSATGAARGSERG